MAILAPQTAPNFATGDYHRILRVEIICSPQEINPRYRVLVGFYANRAARDANCEPMYVNAVDMPFSGATPDPRPGIYDLLMNSALFAGTNAVMHD
jgi:alkylhydroperoxidase/carboxymuconolactone decarboxylase family protein YurZ